MCCLGKNRLNKFRLGKKTTKQNLIREQMVYYGCFTRDRMRFCLGQHFRTTPKSRSFGKKKGKRNLICKHRQKQTRRNTRVRRGEKMRGRGEAGVQPFWNPFGQGAPPTVQTMVRFSNSTDTLLLFVETRIC